MVEKCALCNGEGDRLYDVVDENRRISNVIFSYMKCLACHTIFLAEPPLDMASYYQSSYYQIPTLSKLKLLARKSTTKIDTVRRFVQQGRLLEIGPAFGVFAYQAKQAGFDVDVIEMNQRCSDFVRQELEINAVCSDKPHEAIQSLPKHEVIAIWHVLEHLYDPLAFLQAAAHNLKSNGVLVIAVPNPDALQFRLMGRRWPHLDAPRHITLIPADILTKKARELGLEQVSLDSDDGDARSWNRFGWQRLLMNRFSNKIVQKLMFVVGFFLAWLMAPFEQKQIKGSAYTVVFRKQGL